MHFVRGCGHDLCTGALPLTCDQEGSHFFFFCGREEFFELACGGLGEGLVGLSLRESDGEFSRSSYLPARARARVSSSGCCRFSNRSVSLRLYIDQVARSAIRLARFTVFEDYSISLISRTFIHKIKIQAHGIT